MPAQRREKLWGICGQIVLPLDWLLHSAMSLFGELREHFADRENDIVRAVTYCAAWMAVGFPMQTADGQIIFLVGKFYADADRYSNSRTATDAEGAESVEACATPMRRAAFPNDAATLSRLPRKLGRACASLFQSAQFAAAPTDPRDSLTSPRKR